MHLLWTRLRLSDKMALTKKRSIMIFPNSGGPQFIRAFHGCYDPLAYPILYPGGETGWEDKSILLEETPTVRFPRTRRKYTKRKSEDALKGNSQATCRSGVKRKHVETTIQDICEEQGDCDDNMDEDGEGGKLYTLCLGCLFLNIHVG
ncbi:hypothetical protein PVAP13_8KG259501 [Panicum virgatum]|uniref:Uncharacterized protein n=1 Tax=Panicum virgatum TaxID=38727 RepID=A0A8T0PWP6_PANVG|nr:hypothetical protein PVAP13_8KG259501 [Panicum virgatum]